MTQSNLISVVIVFVLHVHWYNISFGCISTAGSEAMFGHIFTTQNPVAACQFTVVIGWMPCVVIRY